jgi:hypothetical protein
MKLNIRGYFHEWTDGKIDQTRAEPLQAFQSGDVVQAHLDPRVRPSESLDVFGQEIKDSR